MLRKLNRITLLFVILTIAFFTFLFRSPNGQPEPLSQHGPAGSVPSYAVGESLSLAPDQCEAAFPGLNKEIENAVSIGPVQLKRLKDDIPGLVQGRIKNGKLYIISAARENSLLRSTAILHSLHRAIITSPLPMPDTIFALSISDIPRINTWSFSRSDDDLTPNTPWLMPHYSSWSWPQETLGPLDAALVKIEGLERETKWENKIDKAVWRGTPYLGPDWRPGLRLMLVEVGRSQEWADIQDWNYGNNNNTGKSYSGRLPYHQACGSIILTPPPTFLLQHTHLLRPVFSSLLPLAFTPRQPAHPNRPVAPSLESYPLPETAKTWPLSYPPDVANIVFVQPDWADIDLVVDYLRKNPRIAEGIAKRQRELMVEKGYLSEGAEACYWRALVKAWSGVVKAENENEWGTGMRWETFSLLGKTTFDDVGV